MWVVIIITIIIIVIVIRVFTISFDIIFVDGLFFKYLAEESRDDCVDVSVVISQLNYVGHSRAMTPLRGHVFVDDALVEWKFDKCVVSSHQEDVKLWYVEVGVWSECECREDW